MNNSHELRYHEKQIVHFRVIILKKNDGFRFPNKTHSGLFGSKPE